MKDAGSCEGWKETEEQERRWTSTKHAEMEKEEANLMKLEKQEKSKIIKYRKGEEEEQQSKIKEGYVS